MDPSQLKQNVQSASEYIRTHFSRVPEYAIILGTGSGLLADEIEAEVSIAYRDIPHFPSSTALGHKGNLVCGTLANRPLVAMQGRFHLYEGYDVDLATLPVHVMKELGVKTLFVSNASGGLNPKFKSGELMVIDSHIDLMFRSTPNIAPPVACQRPAARSDIYDCQLAEQALECARKHNFNLHRGVYASLLGPNYETRAEYRMLKTIGADVAGMSTTPEITVACKLGLRALAVSIITNVAKPDVLSETTAEEVVNAAETAAPNLTKLFINAIRRN